MCSFGKNLFCSNPASSMSPPYTSVWQNSCWLLPTATHLSFPSPSQRWQSRLSSVSSRSFSTGGRDRSGRDRSCDHCPHTDSHGHDKSVPSALRALEADSHLNSHCNCDSVT